MIWSRALVCLAAVISLLLGVIWPNTAAAAVAPAIVPLGSVESDLAVPGKLDIDAAGNLYVADIKAQKVLKYDASGDLLQVFGAVAASGRGLAVTGDGARLYVAAKDNIAIIDGTSGAVTGIIDLAGAGEIALDANGNVYVVDEPNVQVRVFGPAGNAMSVISGYGTGPGQFRSIGAIGVNDASSEVYVVGINPNISSDSAVVQIFGFDGTRRSTLNTVGGKITSGGGVVFDASGREYFLDKLTGNIHVRPHSTGFAPVVYKLGGSGAGKVVMPWDIAYDAITSRLFVSSDSGEIEVFGVDGGTTPEKNFAPGLPTLVSPVANSEVASLRPQLVFKNAVDLNGDSLTYDIQVAGAPTLQGSVAEDASGQTVFQVGEDLAENTAYSWQVMARDAELDSGWTLSQTFYVNAIEEAPTAPELTAALTGEALNGAGLLSWSASTDPDPFETIAYLVEISDDDTFAAPVVAERFSATEVSLGALADYQNLVPGSDYFWRVTAVDSSGLATVSEEAGRFLYDTAVLSVRANLPDASVYFAGNAAYSGRFVGKAPLELRDVAAGPYTVVVERAGCETFIAQVEVGSVGAVQVNANLLLAKVPELKKASALRSVKSQLQSAALVAPFIVDFDNDDMADLLVGDLDGSVNLFRALAMRGSKVQYGAAEALDFGQLLGTALFVVDWNNDNRKDVLVGAADGSIFKYINLGSDTAPAYNSGLAELLRDGKGAAINVGSNANPAVVDIDADGDKDLVVGAGNGNVYLYENLGSDAAPKLSIEAKKLLPAFSGTVAPTFVDWDADGVRDLLVAAEGNLFRCVPEDDGTYSVAETIISAEDNGIASGARFFVVDSDNSQGKDVYIGQADGLVQIMRSAGKAFLPSASAALLDKLAQVDELATAAGINAQGVVARVKAGIESGDFSAAARDAAELVAASPAGSETGGAADELIALLNQ